MPIWCTFFSVSNIHKNFGNRKWVCPICTELFPICIYTHLTHNWLKKHKLKVMIRILRMKEIFMYRPLFFEWMGVFQSSLDCFSIGVWAFIKNIDFLIFSSLCMLVFICTILKCSNLQSNYTFFQVHRIASDMCPYSQGYSSKARWSCSIESAWKRIIVKTSVWQYLGILLCILGRS